VLRLPERPIFWVFGVDDNKFREGLGTSRTDGAQGTALASRHSQTLEISAGRCSPTSTIALSAGQICPDLKVCFGRISRFDRIAAMAAIGATSPPGRVLVKARSPPHGGPSSRTYGTRWQRIDNHAHQPFTSSSASPPIAHVDEPGAFGIRLQPAAAILRRHGGQSRRAPGRGRMWRSPRVV